MAPPDAPGWDRPEPTDPQPADQQPEPAAPSAGTDAPEPAAPAWTPPHEPASAEPTGAEPAPVEPTSAEPTGAEPDPVVPEPSGASQAGEVPTWSGVGATPTAEQPAQPAWPSFEPAPDRDPVSPPPAAWPGSPTTASAPPAVPNGTRRAALVGALAGAVVSALVAGGVTLALDDDGSTDRPGPVATPVTTSDGALDIQGILAKVQPSVVAIETSTSTSRGVFEGAGSGIVLSADGLILTNAHVLGGLGQITVVLADGTEEQAALVGSSPDDDMALIKVEGVDDLVPAELGSSDELRVGDEVIAIGNALNLGSEPTVTRGIVSAKDRDLSAEGVRLEGLIQTDAAINPGNSGGPLVNAAGQVVGMNTAIVAEAQNLGFSIAIDRARPIIEDLEAGGGDITPDQAFLGVSSSDLDDLTDTVRARFDIEVESGAFVAEVVPGSAAEGAGIEVGDVIIEIDGDEVEVSSDVRDAILDHEPGDTIELVIVRDGEEQSIEVELGRRGDGI